MQHPTEQLDCPADSRVLFEYCARMRDQLPNDQAQWTEQDAVIDAAIADIFDGCYLRTSDQMQHAPSPHEIARSVDRHRQLANEYVGAANATERPIDTDTAVMWATNSQLKSVKYALELASKLDQAAAREAAARHQMFIEAMAIADVQYRREVRELRNAHMIAQRKLELMRAMPHRPSPP